MEERSVLLIDDNDDARYALERTLVHHGYHVTALASASNAVETALRVHPAVLLLDIMMPVVDGYELTRRFKAHPELRFIPVLLVTAKDSLADVIKGLDAGADDYITKPFNTEELLARLRAALRLHDLYAELRTAQERNTALAAELSGQSASIIGSSAKMREVFRLMEKVARSDSPVLIVGASGTGKELVARALHALSPRAAQPFLARNCAAFAETLLESELFGHERGAFTGALRETRGVFEAVDGGTLFLDEVAEMSPSLQAKLLRVLQEGTFSRVGSTAERRVDIRVLAATNRDLLQLVGESKFREDLYYRLNVITIPLPPLSERREDIPELVEHFLKKRAPQRSIRVSPQALELLRSYSWRGNVRELENEIERCVILADGDVIQPEHLSARIQHRTDGEPEEQPRQLRAALEQLEKKLISEALMRSGWNRSQAAKDLDMSRSNLLTKIEYYGLREGAG